MLLFIPLKSFSDFPGTGVSIHLMLLFIQGRTFHRIYLRTFQYISCYSLSKLWTDLYMLEIGFNTSHVTLYRIWRTRTSRNIWVSIHLMLLFIAGRNSHIRDFQTFQYISCYSLSPTCGQNLPPEQMFQYISCYSLSWKKLIGNANTARFNTSHVTLYPSFYRLFFF